MDIRTFRNDYRVGILSKHLLKLTIRTICHRRKKLPLMLEIFAFYNKLYIGDF